MPNVSPNDKEVSYSYSRIVLTTTMEKYSRSRVSTYALIKEGEILEGKIPVRWKNVQPGLNCF